MTERSMVEDPEQYAEAARRLLPMLRATIDYGNLFQGTYAVTSRVKDVERIKTKVEDRRAKGRNYDYSDVSDVIGIRIITHYKDDVPNVFADMLSLIGPGSPTEHNSFSGGRLIELVEYTDRALGNFDPVSSELERMYNASFVNKPPVPYTRRSKDGGYSSVHAVVRIPSSGFADGIGLEIQIRSVFEDVWGQIEHKALYELRRRSTSVSSQVTVDLQRHFSVLKRMLDAAAEYADAIRASFIAPRSNPPSIIKNIDGGGNLELLLIAAGFGDRPDVISRIRALMSKKQLTDDSARSPSQAGFPSDLALRDQSLIYVGIADELQQIAEGELNIVPENEKELSPKRFLFCRILLEGAICRFLSKDQSQVRLSIGIYERVSKLMPDDPAAWYRLGQALTYLAYELQPELTDEPELIHRIDDAYVRAGRIVADANDAPVITSSHTDIASWRIISNDLAQKHGYALWRGFDIRRARGVGHEADVGWLLKALDISLSAVRATSSIPLRHYLINNLLYFFAYGAEFGVSNPDAGRISQQEIRSLAEELFDAASDAASDINQMNFWDTLVHVFFLLKDSERAKSAAGRVLDLNERPFSHSDYGSAYALEMQRRASTFAWRVYRDREEAFDDAPNG